MTDHKTFNDTCSPKNEIQMLFMVHNAFKFVFMCWEENVRCNELRKILL